MSKYSVQPSGSPSVSTRAQAVKDANPTDFGPFADLLAPLRHAPGCQLSEAEGIGLIVGLARTEAAGSGAIRGARHTTLDDSDISSTRHARSFVGGVLDGITGLTELFVSGGAAHQGPSGSGPCAVGRAR